MKKTILGAVAASFIFAGCASSPIASALNFTTHSTGGDAGVAMDKTAKAKKIGTSSCTGILGIVAFGDCSVEAAAKDGKIKRIKSVSHDTTNILYIYSNYSTTVKGE